MTRCWPVLALSAVVATSACGGEDTASPDAASADASAPDRRDDAGCTGRACPEPRDAGMDCADGGCTSECGNGVCDENEGCASCSADCGCSDGFRCVEDRCISAEECPAEGCPEGTYCDLGMDRCVSGCLEDDECGDGQICLDRRCVTGCRDDEQCGSRRICEDHSCVVGCRECPDDRNECTETRCVDGECVHEPVDDDTPCRNDANVCTVDLCRDGVCEHLPDPDFPVCSMRDYPGSVCIESICRLPTAYCTVSDEGTTYALGSLAEWCECDGDELKWEWHSRVGGGTGSRACNECRSYRWEGYREQTVIGCWD